MGSAFRIAVASVAVAILPVALLAATFPSGFSSELVVGGLSFPTVMDWAPDGRIFIGHKDGRVLVFENGVLLPTPFIDVGDEVNDYHDRGFLGLAVHPNFPTSPYVYLLYTYDPPETASLSGAEGQDGFGARLSRLVRVTADPADTNVALAGSEVVLLGGGGDWSDIGDPMNGWAEGPGSCEELDQSPKTDCLASDSPTHTIGSVVFDSTGALLVSVGDGATTTGTDPRSLKAQDLDSLQGKILRIDPLTGDGLSDNPYYDGDPGSNRSKVLDLGLRNPFRISLDSQTGALYIGDVGMNSWEELNSGTGRNFGWPCYEGGDGGNLVVGSMAGQVHNGLSCDAIWAAVSGGGISIEPALHAYDHSLGGASVQAGGVYWGSAYPPEYDGAVFFADYNRDWIRYLLEESPGNWTDHDFGTQVSDGGGVVQLTLGPDSNLHYIAFNRVNPFQSEIRRIRYTSGGNTPPTAVAGTVGSSDGDLPLLVQFTSTGSFDPDGDPLDYFWDFGDGATSTDADPLHTYTLTGSFVATLTVEDPEGETGVDSVQVEAGSWRPVAQINAPTGGSSYDVGDSIPFVGFGTDVEDGNLPGTSLDWQLWLHHNDHVHFDGLPPTSGTSGTFVVPDHGNDTSLELCLFVTDSSALTGSECVSLAPNEVLSTFESVPSGLELSVEGVLARTPFSVQTIVGSQQVLVAPTTQSYYGFTGWSDGGARVHAVDVTSTPTSFTASYLFDPPGSIAASCPVTGVVTHERWDDISGTLISDLTGEPEFPDDPAYSGYLPGFDLPRDQGSDYGSRLRGYVLPPVTGDYTFWISSDDYGELWLSTDEDPANATVVADVPGWTFPDEWTKYTDQRSAPISLTAGELYYIEALHKEASGGDHLTIAWEPPGESRTTLGGGFVCPFTDTAAHAACTDEVVSVDVDRDLGVQWSTESNASSYSVYRGYTIPGRPFEYTHRCSDVGITGSSWLDPLEPRPMTLLYYVVAPNCSGGGIGSVGSDSTGALRPRVPICPDPGLDGDGDGVDEAIDRCPGVYDPAQLDSDSDSHGDPCDNCPGPGPAAYNPAQLDMDGDSMGDVCDVDRDGDGIEEDGDGSGIAGDAPCADQQTVGCDDNCGLTGNPEQYDSDLDGIGDACDPTP